MGSVVVVVPWFSREEWLETYEAAFSSDVRRWKDAKDTMLVWQARVEKLPAGIDVTLPLLQAKIMETDPTIDEATRSIFLASALQRFVTAILKLPQTKYYRAQSMHNLALEIGLPMHLVDLRNEIVHGHGGWGGGESVHKALEDSYKWIKSYYWDAEYHKIHLIHSLSTVTPEGWQSFLDLLKKYAKLTVSFAKKKIPLFNKVKDEVIQQLETLYSLEPDDCAKAVVHYILVPDSASGLPKQMVNEEACQCGCCIDGQVLGRVVPLLECFCRLEKGTELLLSHLIRKGHESPKLSSEWACIISGSLLEMRCFSGQEQHCTDHSLTLADPPAEVSWRRVVTELLQDQTQWASEAAWRLMDSPETGLADVQKDKITSLVQLFHEAPKPCGGAKNKTHSHSPDFYTVDDILVAAKSLPLSHRRRLEKLRAGSSSDLEAADCPVGVLPHQTDNPLLYKDMVLRYPGSGVVTPPAKRCRVML